MKKLHLAEDMEQEVVEPVVKELQSGTLISSLIKAEWDLVDLYNSILITMQGEELPDEVGVILNEIITDQYKNIGQLEKCLQLVNKTSLQIENGREEAIEVIES